VVADSTKIGIIGLVSLIHLDQVDKLVTNPDAPPDFLAEARRLGVEVILA
jgi:DeoR/GlpR family transcriptional regulator of sugar metabolism